MRDQGKTIRASALASGMSERSAYEWKSGLMPSQAKKPHDWRTRADPFADVWEAQIVPMLTAKDGNKLQAKTIWKLIQWPEGEAHKGSLRTLQRRMSEWRVTFGPEKEVFFPQETTPGLRAGFDFTCCNELEVTVAGEPFQHLFFEYVLHDSGWRDVTLAHSETYEAMVLGLQNAFWKSGGVPRQVRHDNLSAAVREHSPKRELFTKRYDAFLKAYGLQPLPINSGKSHENGACEQAHFRWKSALTQALIVRQSREFSTVSAYESFALRILSELNDACKDAFEHEKAMLKALPTQRLPDYTEFTAKVLRWSTIRVNGWTYSVPSRLIGEHVRIRQFADHLEIAYRSNPVTTIKRGRGSSLKAINYRHVVHWLARKPGAFSAYVHREEMFPTATFRRAYDTLVALHPSRADVDYLRILECAALHGEREVEILLAVQLGAQQPIVASKIIGHFAPKQSEAITQAIHRPDLASYDELLGVSQVMEGSYVQ